MMSPTVSRAQLNYPLPTSRPFCSYCTVSGSVAIRTNTLATEGSFTIHLAARDSLQGTVYGPLGIVAARAYCTQDELLVFDAIAMDAYRIRIPSATALNILPFPLRRTDIFALLRCELPYPDSTYTIAQERTDRHTAIAVHMDTAFVDLAEVGADGQLRAYQRKTRDNRLLFAIEYRDWRAWEQWLYPSEIWIASPTQNIELILTPEAITELSTPFPFRFRLPQSVRPRTIE